MCVCGGGDHVFSSAVLGILFVIVEAGVWFLELHCQQTKERRHQTVNLSSEWLIFFPAYFTQCIDSSVKLCFHRDLFPFRAHFSVSIQKSWEVHRVICIPLNGCPWTNTTRSVKLNTDGKFNNVCFYCRKLYQCAEELGYPPTITHFSMEEQLYSAKLADL